MSTVNVKLGNNTFNGIDTIQLQDATVPSTYHDFTLGSGLSGQILKIQSGKCNNDGNYLWTPLWGGFVGAVMGVKMLENKPVFGGGDAMFNLYQPFGVDSPAADYGQTYTVLNPAQNVNYKYLEGNIYYGISSYTYDGNYSAHLVFDSEAPLRVYVVDFEKITHLLNTGYMVHVEDVAGVDGAILDSFEVPSEYLDDGILHPLPVVNVDSNTKIILMANPTEGGGS